MLVYFQPQRLLTSSPLSAQQEYVSYLKEGTHTRNTGLPSPYIEPDNRQMAWVISASEIAACGGQIQSTLRSVRKRLNDLQLNNLAQAFVLGGHPIPLLQ